MNRTKTVGLVIGALALVALASGVVQSRAGKDSPRLVGSPAANLSGSPAGNLAGAWRLDLAQSDLPRRGGWEGRGGRGRGDGLRSEGDRKPGDPGAGDYRGERRFRRRGPGMPPVFRVAVNGSRVEFRDSTGTMFQEVQVGASVPPASEMDGDRDVRQLSGTWTDGTLLAERSGPRGGTVQKYTLGDQGRTLEILVERKGGGGSDRASDGSGRRFGPRGPIKLVYRRIA